MRVGLHSDTRGAGDPLLLIAGLGCDAGVWQPVADDLSRRFRVVTFDNRGAGRSGVPAEPYGIRGMAGDAVALLDRLALRSAHVLGHSMGGYIAQELAVREFDAR